MLWKIASIGIRKSITVNVNTSIKLYNINKKSVIMNPRIKYFNEVSSKPMSESERKELKKESNLGLYTAVVIFTIIIMTALTIS